MRVCGGLSVTMGGAGGSGVLRGCGMVVNSRPTPRVPLIHSRYSRPESQYESILAHGAGKKHVFRPGLSTARRIARVGCRAMPTRRGTCSRPCVGRGPRKGQGEIPGAEQSAPELCVISGGHKRQVPNRAPTYTECRISYSCVQRYVYAVRYRDPCTVQ